MIRVLIAEDHGIVRAGLLQLLVNATDMEVVGLAARGVEAVELARATRPDVVLMDLAMPDLDGIEATREIAEMAPQVRVLILTAFSDGPHVLAALDAGAAGYLHKDCDPDALYGAIRQAHAEARSGDRRHEHRRRGAQLHRGGQVRHGHRAATQRRDPAGGPGRRPRVPRRG